ncbi:hypothetical protein [Candidatus Tisiphia endosymbiont of Oplodontha viridula]|uniref:hypothetical protein n=1 Tax=Candidatus Tisiphia endosymbiont of Oplodontha viridula TaxID=3077925 RepID=UPI0035C8AC45
MREATLVVTKQSKKVIRNGLLRRLTPSRNDGNLLWINANWVSYSIPKLMYEYISQ